MTNILAKPALTEGPNLYKRNGWYYLMLAEGGTGWNHGISMARSRSITGPYELDPQESVLTSRDDEKLVAYLSDCSAVPEEIARQIEDVKVLIIDALRHEPHPTHLSVSQALDVAERVRPQQTWLTHICHQLPQSAETSLPPNTGIAYDGLKLRL
jgi:phosphoribosyl 1,2-cyclic phosphodiesterase